MNTTPYQFSFEPFLENRRSFLLLRWLVVILSSYLTLFSHLENQNFPLILTLALAFSLSNVAAGLFSMRLFVRARSQHWFSIADGIFISSGLFLMRVRGVPVHFLLIAIFIVTLVSRDFRLVLVSLLATSVLFGAFRNLTVFGFGGPGAVEQFLGLALLFVVATFYVFLTDRPERDAASSTNLIEESRHSEIMVEVTQMLSASMNPDEIYDVVVSALCEVMDGAECSIVKVVGDEATVLARSDDAGKEALDVFPLVRAPILIEAWSEHSTVIERIKPENSEGALPLGSYMLAVPMVSRGEVLGMIYFPGDGVDIEPSETTVQFFEVVASTAANALRNVEMFEEMKHLAHTDFLTGLPNHRYFQSSLAREVGRAERHDHALSLLLIDLDCLKQVNDRFGHQAGDSVIRAVAGTISRTCREIDFAARYGGEEFVVILPETDLPGAVLVAERIRRNIETTEVGIEVGVTASVGVASYPTNSTTREDLVRTADQALYVAKNAGRNQVAHFKHQLIAR